MAPSHHEGRPDVTCQFSRCDPISTPFPPRAALRLPWAIIFRPSGACRLARYARKRPYDDDRPVPAVGSRSANQRSYFPSRSEPKRGHRFFPPSRSSKVLHSKISRLVRFESSLVTGRASRSECNRETDERHPNQFASIREHSRIKIRP
jgi:hypothetical protein